MSQLKGIFQKIGTNFHDSDLNDFKIDFEKLKIEFVIETGDDSNQLIVYRLIFSKIDKLSIEMQQSLSISSCGINRFEVIDEMNKKFKYQLVGEDGWIISFWAGIANFSSETVI